MCAHGRSDTSAALVAVTPESVRQGATTVLRRLAALLITLALVAAGLPSAASATAPVAVDLGTLGGSDSFSTAQNAFGQVDGDSITATGAQHPFFWSRATGMVDVGSLGGPAVNSDSGALSDTGQVVGESLLSNSSNDRHAFSWTRRGGMVDLGTLGGPTSNATAVNDFGQVVGASVTGDGTTHAFLWTPAGGMVDLGTLGGDFTNSGAGAINALGQVVGASVTPSGQIHAFSWTPRTGMIDLGALPEGGNSVLARVLNVLGQVAGVSDTTAGAFHAFSWTARTGMIDLGTLGGASSEPSAINAGGQIVGDSTVPTGDRHAFSWIRATGMVDLGTLGGGESMASAVNLAGQVVGLSNPTGSPTLHHGGNSDAFSWTTRTGMVALGALGGTHNSAVAVDNAGQIAGQSQTSAGPTHAVIWLTGH
jgi:probable HAF family extracellular repeat protein